MQNRDFKGIWIPKEIWLDENLSIVEKALLAEIDSLDPCVASNDYFAQFFGVSERTITRAITHLREIGLVEYSFDGRTRTLRLDKMSRQTRQNVDQLNNDISTRDNNTNNQQELFEDNNTSNNYNKEKEDLTDKVHDFIAKYNSMCPSLPACQRYTAKREKAIIKLVKKYPWEDILTVFEKLEASDFCSGRSGKWRANIDFILREDKFISVLEGKYDNHKPRCGVETISSGDKKQYTAEERERIIKNGKKF